MHAAAEPVSDLAARVRELSWYHTIQLPGVLTPGWFDTRRTLGRVPLPASLEGSRCLDVGTWDGFWAFEMERRGAAEVVAIDIEDPLRWDWPPRAVIAREGMAGSLRTLDEFKSHAASFSLAHEALGSRVQRSDLSVYELDPTRVGHFDFVFLGSLLLHLCDPIRALDRVRAVCSGEAVIADCVQAISSLLRPRTPMAQLDGLDRPWWWTPNVAGLHRMVESAGFEIVQRSGLYTLPLGPSHPRLGLRDALGALRSPDGRERLIMHARGLPHAAVRVVPIGP